jgi:hypothetical protein
MATKAYASVVASDNDLLNWRYDPYPLANSGDTFGNVVYDSVAAVYRLFYHRQTDNTIRQKISMNPRVFGNDSLVLGHGAVGSPDETQTGVPFVWYETGQIRPWRMIYRGCRNTDGECTIMLATSIDGVTWERKDISGNVLPTALSITNIANNGGGLIRVTVASHPWNTGDSIMVGGVTGTGSVDINNNTLVIAHRYWVITKIDASTFDLQGSSYNSGHAYVGGVAGQSVLQSSETGLWDSSGIDFGGVIKVGSVYYLYYDTINTSARKIGLATSIDLIHWTKDLSNPIFSGVTDYSDKNHDGTVDLTAGFFCPDIVYWPRADGTDRYVMIIPHYVTNHLTSSLDVYTSDTPIFAKANRTYIGKAFETASGTKYLQGSQVIMADTPRIITDDITRNVVTSQNTGNDVLLVNAVESSINWNEVMLVHHKTLDGLVLSNISEDFPVTAPTFQLAPTAVDLTTKGLWLPGLTRSLRDMAGGVNHLIGPYTQINSNGVKLINTNLEKLSAGSSSLLSSVNAITGDFTLETRVSFASNFTSSFRSILGYGTITNIHHFYLYVGGAAGPTYTLNFTTTSGGVSKTSSIALGSITLDQMYRITVTRTGGKIYFFKDGILLNSGGTAFAWTIDSSPTGSLYLGANDVGGATFFWDGYIDEIRISDTARWTSNYTPVALFYVHQPSGNIFTKVYDFGTSNTQSATIVPTMTTPTGTSVSLKVRSATSASDQSSTIEDFSSLPQAGITNQYQQFALALASSDTTQTPTISSADVQSLDLQMPTNISISSITPDSASQLTVTALTATDFGSGLNVTPYYFTETSGNPGGSSSSDWQTSTAFVDTGLSANTQYTYEVKARDANLNQSAYSATVSKYTLAPTPTNFSAHTNSDSITVSADTFTNSTNASSGYYFSRSGGGNSGWIQTNSWEETGLACGNSYSYSVKYRNGDGVETDQSSVTGSTNSCGGGMIWGSGPNAPGYQRGVVVQAVAPTATLGGDPVSKLATAIASTTPAMVQSSKRLIFPKNLKLWDKGEDVRGLQKFLNMHKFMVSKNGVGSLGHESFTFGPATYRALVRFQRANGIQPTGYLGPITRRSIANMSAN